MSEHNATPDTPAPKQKRTGLTSTGARKAAAKSNRTRAREFALQALYQHLVGRNEATAIDLFTRDLAGFGVGNRLSPVPSMTVAPPSSCNILVAIEAEWKAGMISTFAVSVRRQNG